MYAYYFFPFYIWRLLQYVKVIGCILKGDNYKNGLPSFLKGIYTKRKEFAPHGSKFFHFRVDPFYWGW